MVDKRSLWQRKALNGSRLRLLIWGVLAAFLVVVFYGPLMRNWQRSDGRGKGSLERLVGKIYHPEGSDPSDTHNARIVPDGKTLRVVRKIIRGLYYHHLSPLRQLPQVISDDRIYVLPYYDALPQSVAAMPEWRVIHPAVFGYGFVECREPEAEYPGVDSLWLMSALNGAIFASIVTANTFPFVGSLAMG